MYIEKNKTKQKKNNTIQNLISTFVNKTHTYAQHQYQADKYIVNQRNLIMLMFSVKMARL